jgi:beta-lactamase class A
VWLAVIACPSAALADNYFPAWPVALQTDVVRTARTFPGEFAIYVKDLSDGTRYEYNAATPMYLASAVKVPVMIELFRQVDAKQVSLEEELVYSDPDVRDGAPLLSYLRVGTPVSVQILLEAMIQQSDNAATDMLIRHVGIDNINRGLVKEGVFGFGPISTMLDVRRLMLQHIDPATADFTPQQIFQVGVTRPLDARLALLAEMIGKDATLLAPVEWTRAFEAYYGTGFNTASLQAVGAMLESLERGKVVSASRSRQMIEIMLGTQTGARRIRAGLPPGALLAHKTGTQFRRICDIGIFYMTSNRPVVFAACVKGGRKRAAEEVIARIARRTYWHLSPPSERKKIKPYPDPIVGAEDEDEDEIGEDIAEPELMEQRAKKIEKKGLKLTKGKKKAPKKKGPELEAQPRDIE